VSVFVKLNDKVVKLSIYKGIEVESMIKDKLWGCKLRILDEQVSSPYV